MRIENLKKQIIIYSTLPRLSLFFVFSVVLSQFVFSENSENIKSTESFSLEQAVNLAVQNNYEIKKQRYALAAAQAQYRQVKGLRCVVEGGREVIKELHARGYKLGIISNLIGENEIPDWLKEDRLDDYFDALVLSSVCGIRKPDPRAYHMACEQLGLKPEECASVADNLNRDITGAIAAGIGANILYISEKKLAKSVITDENRPDYIVHRFIDILDVPILK